MGRCVVRLGAPLKDPQVSARHPFPVKAAGIKVTGDRGARRTTSGESQPGARFRKSSAGQSRDEQFQFALGELARRNFVTAGRACPRELVATNQLPSSGPIGSDSSARGLIPASSQRSGRATVDRTPRSYTLDSVNLTMSVFTGREIDVE